MLTAIKNRISSKRAELDALSAEGGSLRSDQHGVTIIELMIVIAVAALILVLVLVAAPALRQNAQNGQRLNDKGALVGQLTQNAANNNNQYPDLTKFNAEVLAQVSPAIYETAAATGKTTTLATNIPVVPTIIYHERIPATDTQAKLNTAMALQAYPSEDEIHIIVGVKCLGSDLTNGGYEPGDAGVAYVGGDLLLASSRVFVVVYQLAGEGKASCEDN